MKLCIEDGTLCLIFKSLFQVSATPVLKKRGVDVAVASREPAVVLQKVASELHPKVRNQGEGPY